MKTNGDRLKGVIHFKRQKGFFLTHSLSAQVLFYYFAHGQRGPRVTRLGLNETTVSSKHDDKSQVLSVTCGLFFFVVFFAQLLFLPLQVHARRRRGSLRWRSPGLQTALFWLREVQAEAFRAIRVEARRVWGGGPFS